MPWLLDTNHWIFLLKGRCVPLQERLRHVSPDDVWFCSIVKEELHYGAEGYDDKAARMARLASLFSRHASAPFDDEAAAIAGRIRKELEDQRQVIGQHDIQIAAIALQHGWTVVTNNTSEFKRVSGLQVEDWTV
ncbi:type II toxin-antitoxin system VapC family toxin [Prosthecobacter sp.]|uniref:type II toxin-antitoxin system VapC family toxin n=1 Tax=Prosthecobacter sp. TaxID=1965333 RepID=UPI0037842812